jgi:glucosamine--fructose-6-phosphate aminotransferase (isomerizing)
MCGIVGYNISGNSALEMVLASLQSLEYRGYDSAGASYVKNGRIITNKTVGRVSNLQEICPKNEAISVAIAHTRWATHGGAVTVNAHPHHVNNISLIHNGIIENYTEIKKELQGLGCQFTSSTDTEVISQYIAYHIKNTSIDKVIQDILSKFLGKYAIAFLLEGDDTIYIARSKGSPIVIGFLKNGHAVASDFNALAPHTDTFSVIGDYEYVRLNKDNVVFYNKSGDIIAKKTDKYDIKQQTLTKDGFDTFMLKEIYEQPDVIKNLTHNYIDDVKKVHFPNFEGIGKFKKIVAIACGTSFYACFLGKHLIEKYADIPVSVSISSEFHASKQFWEDDTLYIFASQSGETADTISAMEFVIANKKESSKVLSILNYTHSSMSQKSDFTIQCFAGIEVGVASTKNFIAQVVVFYLLAIQGNNLYQSVIDEIKLLPQTMQDLLQNKTFYNSIHSVAEKIVNSKKVVYTGRTMLYPIACEGALKLSELSYLIVQPIPSGEFKHGPIAIVDNSATVISLTHSQNLYHKTLSSNEEIRARNGNVIEISDDDNATISLEGAKNFPHTYPILLTIAVQLISYYTAQTLGNDIDKPRNLAKSVTVE